MLGYLYILPHVLMDILGILELPQVGCMWVIMFLDFYGSSFGLVFLKVRLNRYVVRARNNEVFQHNYIEVNTYALTW